MKSLKRKIVDKLHLAGNKKKVALNIFWAMLGKIVNMAGALLVAILVARYLGPENYGVMNYVISYVAMFMVLSEFGMSSIEIRELSSNPDKKESILGTCFVIRLIFSVITYILIVITLWVFKTDSFTTSMILLYSLSLFANTLQLIRNYFTSIVKNEYVVKSEISRTIIGAIIKIVLVCLNCSVEWFIFASLLDTVLVASGYFFSYRTIVGKITCWKFEKNMVWYIIKESFPLVLSGAAVVIYQRIDQVMIGNMIDKSSVAYFATAGKFLDLVIFLPMVLTQTITPLLVVVKEENYKKYVQKKYQFLSVVLWISIILSVFLSVSSYWLIYYSYGEKYLSAVPVLQIMAFNTVGMALSSSSGELIIIEKMQKWDVIRNLIGCIVCVTLNYLLIPKYGIVGSAWVTILTLFSSGLLGNFMIPRYRPIARLQLKALFLGWKEVINLKKMRQ